MNYLTFYLNEDDFKVLIHPAVDMLERANINRVQQRSELHLYLIIKHSIIFE